MIIFTILLHTQSKFLSIQFNQWAEAALRRSLAHLKVVEKRRKKSKAEGGKKVKRREK